MRYRLRTLLILVSTVPPIVGIVAFGAGEIILAAIPYLACIALVKRYVLSDQATFLR
jgi:hypothetical protein